MARQLDERGLAELDRATEALRKGQPLPQLPSSPAIAAIFAPGVRAFWKSEMDLDPAALLHDVKSPTVIVQGETDAQVSVEDARLLAAARPDAKLVLLPRGNHLFKEEATRALPQASYTDPARPLVPGVVEAIAALAHGP
jgi:pimeloyl-ACP methyl ester carboxylesterase